MKLAAQNLAVGRPDIRTVLGCWGNEQQEGKPGRGQEAWTGA